MPGRKAEAYSVADARLQAKRILPRPVFDFIDGGAEDEVTLRWNLQAFEATGLTPQNAVDVGRPSLSTTVLGQPVRFPVLLAPCGLARVLHPDAEPGAARAAESAGTIAIVSTASGRPLEDFAAATSRGWFQLYFFGGRPGAERLVARASASGFKALVVTIDTAVSGKRERDIRNGVAGALSRDFRTAVRLGPSLAVRPQWLYRFVRDGMSVEFGNGTGIGQDNEAVVGDGLAEKRAAIIAHPPTWEDVEWLRQQWDRPLVVKGVLSADDARRAVGAGADAVVVSNHGGRQLDGAPASLDVLPEVVAAVGDQVEVYVDGGIRRGSHVVKALAVGARAVLVGRPWLYGLAVGGEAGVRRVLDVLRDEMDLTMRLVGAPDVRQLDAGLVRRRPPAPAIAAAAADNP